MTARVTVGIPVANGQRFIAEALDSVRAQTFGDLEILVADNGSTDGTEEIVRAAMREDPRITYLPSEVNRGGPWNMNRLAQAASAPLFKYAFYDDVCGPELISDCVQAIDAHPDHVLAHARVITIDERGEVTGAHSDAYLGLELQPAHRRLVQFFTRNAEQALFGVIRTEVLRDTRGIQRSVADGHLLMTELILRGPFVAVDAQHQQLRFHSAQHGGDRKSEMRWLGARRRDRVFGYSRVTGKLAAAIQRAPLPTAEKARCLAVVARYWTLRTWRSSLSDVKHLAEDLRGD